MTCTAVQELYRSSLVSPLIPILKGVFWSKRQSCTVLGSMLTEISVFVWELAIIAMENFQSDLYGRTCPGIQELYRSSLVCPLIPILRGVFWSKRQSCTVLGSMLTEI